MVVVTMPDRRHAPGMASEAPFQWSSTARPHGFASRTLEQDLVERMRGTQHKVQKSYGGKRHATRSQPPLPMEQPRPRPELGRRPGSYATTPELLQLFEEKGGYGCLADERKVDLTRLYVKPQYLPWLRREERRTQPRDLDAGTPWSSRNPLTTARDRELAARDRRRDQRRRDESREAKRPASADQMSTRQSMAHVSRARPGTAPSWSGRR